MHSANASFLGSTPSTESDIAEKKQSDVYLLWSTANSSLNSLFNSSNIFYSLATGSNFAVAFNNDSTAILLAEHEATKVTTALANHNFTAAFGNGTANYIDLEEVIGPVRDPMCILMSIVYAVIFVTGVTGNLLTCLVIARQRYLHNATNYYLFSLAVSDLIFLLLGLPHDVSLLWQRYPYMFGEAFCILRGLVSELCTNCSILVIVGFTIERYFAICFPLRSHTFSMKLSRVVKIIALTWVIGTLSAIPIAMQFGLVLAQDENHQPYPGTDHCAVKRLLYPYIFEIATLAFFVVPILVITILYILIGIKLRASSRGSSSNRGQRTKNQEGRHPLSMSIRRQNSSRRAVIKMLVCVVLAFFCCFAPFHAQRVMAMEMARNESTDENLHQLFNWITHISGITYYLSASINPILYQMFSKKFQMGLRETLPCCKKFDDPHDAEIAFSAVLPASSRPPNSHSSKQTSFYGSSSPKSTDTKS